MKNVEKNNETKKQKTQTVEEEFGTSFSDKNVFLLNGYIDTESIEKALCWIINENLSVKEKTLTLYINSEGGELGEAFALIDLMRCSKHKIRTIGIGNLMSSAFLIFVSGTIGQRYIGRNTSILCHQFSEEIEGKFHDLKSQMKEGERVNERMVNLIVNQSKLSKNSVKTKLMRKTDVWLSAEQMIEYGVADFIL